MARARPKLVVVQPPTLVAPPSKFLFTIDKMYTIELKTLKKKYSLKLNDAGSFAFHSSDPDHF